MLYINEPSIVVGKHQNALSEINLEYVRKNNIKVARRLSGGGTVFHDFGNLNFCFIQTARDKNLINFSKFIEPIVSFLQGIGVDAKAGAKNDILIEGFKISGNAEHIFKQRILHHGTLLFNSKLDSLSEAIKVNLHRFTDRSVQSRRSKVANISDFLLKQISMEDFRTELFNYLNLNSADAQTYNFSSEEIFTIEKLEQEKFATWDWNFGYSPKYEFRNSIVVAGNNHEVFLEVEKGCIINAVFYLNELEDSSFKIFSDILVGHRHDMADISSLIEDLFSERKIQAIEKNDLLSLLF